MNIREVIEKLEGNLIAVAKKLIATNRRLPEDWRERFINSPDTIEEHEPSWHQWGIITHSLKFRQMYQDELYQYLEDWDLLYSTTYPLTKGVDMIPKSELIMLSMPLHDLGKFRKGFEEKDGKIKSDFDHHEKLSQEIVLEELSGKLERLELTERQIAYIANCAGKHFELGFVRKEAKSHPLGYTIAFAESDAFREIIESRLPSFRGFEVEIGLLFLADSLAKTDVIIKAETDAKINEQASWVEAEIARRGLNSKLIDAVKQRPVNIAVARRYLELI